MTPSPQKRRCAIYTRKSSEEGLEQDFNSLQAQREACEAYVLSQAGEGWSAIPTLYDDGGFSGGNVQRPALQRLIADIGLGKIDVVVVYKVDRLTRSLADFAKIVESFDAKGVSFVSVTQAFNTTSSMGRLTLNVLLSFAQFEREVTSERIRDKIAASKKKGMWMGGCYPLGYDPSGRTLVVNNAEAATVRLIFERYLQLRSVNRLVGELQADGCRSKIRTTKAGKVLGGAALTPGALYHLLSNRTYLGEVPHKGEFYPGQHPAIIDQPTFDAVQTVLAENRRRNAEPSVKRSQAVLAGKIVNDRGEPMTPSFAEGKSGARYRYYISVSLSRGAAKCDPDRIDRLPGPPMERFMLETLERLRGVGKTPTWDEARSWLKQIKVRSSSVVLTFDLGFQAEQIDRSDALRLISANLQEGETAIMQGDDLLVMLPLRLMFRGGRTWLIGTRVAAMHKTRPDRTLIGALARAHKALRQIGACPLQDPRLIEQSQGLTDSYDRRLSKLAFLAPDIQQAILAGWQPAGLNLKEMIGAELPLSWREQRRLFGFGGVV